MSERDLLISGLAMVLRRSAGHALHHLGLTTPDRAAQLNGPRDGVGRMGAYREIHLPPLPYLYNFMIVRVCGVVGREGLAQLTDMDPLCCSEGCSARDLLRQECCGVLQLSLLVVNVKIQSPGTAPQVSEARGGVVMSRERWWRVRVALGGSFGCCRKRMRQRMWVYIYMYIYKDTRGTAGLAQDCRGEIGTTDASRREGEGAGGI